MAGGVLPNEEHGDDGEDGGGQQELRGAVYQPVAVNWTRGRRSLIFKNNSVTLVPSVRF